ncbi:MAG: 50S ribosomal protein L4 [Ignavibacteria bacterium GWF2_33_9]|nr:MAG: 50S ribosomal protein L4 [Ignavibacteria bacterium GWF2_33_9]
MQIDVYNQNGEIIGKQELNDAVFAIEPNEYAMHQTIVAYLANLRQGNAKTKVRSEVRGGGKKPWKQKGRGTARAGSTRSPLWKGGGTIHGPKPHSHELKVPIKVKRLAKKSAFSVRVTENNLKVLAEFGINEFKTKKVNELLIKLNMTGQSTLFLTENLEKAFYMSARNIPKVKVQEAEKISAYDILRHKNIVILQKAVQKIEDTLK